MRYTSSLLALLISLPAFAETVDLTAKAKDSCATHFSTSTQAPGELACMFGAAALFKEGHVKAAEACKEKFPVSRRDNISCRIGMGLAQELQRSSELDEKKLKTCQEAYPVVTALDAYFQEACLAGAYALETNAKPNLSICQSLSADPSFIGPCAAGLTANMSADETKGSATDQNKLCLQYFDKTQFHTGYRACLSSRALVILSETDRSSMIKQCDSVISNTKNETEKAACLVGASIFRSVTEGKPLPSRFQACGEGKVSYQDRPYLACLTAASLLDFMDKPKARSACKTVFNSRKSRSRSQCSHAIEKF